MQIYSNRTLWKDRSMKRLIFASVTVLLAQTYAQTPVVAARQTQSASSLLSTFQKYKSEDDRYGIRFMSEARYPALAKNARVLSDFAINYALARWYGDALKLSDKAVELSPKDDYVLASRAWVLLKNKNPNIAMAPAKRAVSLQPNARSLAILAEVLQARGDIAGADDAMSKARKAEPNSLYVTGSSARIMIARMKGSEALAEVSKYVQAHPNDLRALVLRSDTAEIVGQRKQCIADLTTILKLQPKHGYALQKRAEAYQKDKEYSRASADIRQLLALDFDVGVKMIANKTLAECQERLGNLEEAYKARANVVALAQKSFKSDLTSPANSMPVDFTKDTIDCCRLEIATKRYANALSKLDAILLSHPNYTRAREQRAYALEGLSKWNDALADWSRLITKQPSYPKWYENRARVYMKLGNGKAATGDLETAKMLLQD